MAGTRNPEERYRELYERCYNRVLAFCVRRSSGSEAADVAADTFAVAWRKLDQVPDGDEAILWLYRVARKTLSNHRRGLLRYQRLTSRLAGFPPEHVAPFDYVIVGQSEHKALLEALTRLRPLDQEILRLTAWEDLPRSQIAVILGCSREAVDKRFERALQRLETQLKLDGWHSALRSTSRTEPGAM